MISSAETDEGPIETPEDGVGHSPIQAARLSAREFALALFLIGISTVAAWMRGAPQLGLSAFMRRINCRISSLIFGRPGRRNLDRNRQNSRNPARCQDTTVSGFTTIRALVQLGHRWRSAIQKADPERADGDVAVSV